MKFLPAGITSKLGVGLLKVRAKSPAITFGIGIAGVVGTAVLASRATLKLDAVLEHHNETLSGINTIQHDEYSDEDRVRDRALLYVKTSLAIGRLYLPAIAAGTITIAALTTSHVTLTKRNVALTAAYAAVEKAFSQYRTRVIEDLGEESDRKYRFGLEKDKRTEVNDEGKKVTKTVNVPTSTSTYGKLFAPGNVNWQNVPEYNFLFLRGVQNMMNDRLQAYGFVFLNDVYKELGFEPTTPGQVVGWLRDGNGDGYIDLGIFDDKDLLRIHEYVTGREDELLLDFNVDGVIYDQLDKI